MIEGEGLDLQHLPGTEDLPENLGDRDQALNATLDNWGAPPAPAGLSEDEGLPFQVRTVKSETPNTGLDDPTGLAGIIDRWKAAGNLDDYVPKPASVGLAVESLPKAPLEPGRPNTSLPPESQRPNHVVTLEDLQTLPPPADTREHPTQPIPTTRVGRNLQ